MRRTSPASEPVWKRPANPVTGSPGSRRLDHRFAALAERYGLADDAVAKLRRLHRLLVEDPLAPTAVRDPLKVIDDHLADSLVALELEQLSAARVLADLGSGAGLPGLPLAIARPGMSVALVDSAARKAAFLESAVAQCEAGNVRVVHTRVEAWQQGLAAFDLVTARALAPLEVVVEYAAPLLALGGTLVVWRGQREPEAESVAQRAASEVGLEPGEIVSVRPYPAAESRHLHLMSKVMDTPGGFPRRPGMAAKRPLGRR
jgi:16S rRNA (guanine527-N7)-methyltransferase